jgi:hypothetical protein
MEALIEAQFSQKGFAMTSDVTPNQRIQQLMVLKKNPSGRYYYSLANFDYPLQKCKLKIRNSYCSSMTANDRLNEPAVVIDAMRLSMNYFIVSFVVPES